MTLGKQLSNGVRQWDEREGRVEKDTRMLSLND